MGYVKGLDDNPLYAEMIHWLRKNIPDYLYLDNDVSCYPNRYAEFDHYTQFMALFRDLRKHLIDHLKLEAEK